MRFVSLTTLVCILFLLFAVANYASEDSTGVTDPVRRIVDSLNAEGERHLEVLSSAGYDSARVLFDSALALAERTFGTSDLAVARSLVGLVYCDYWSKDHSRIEQMAKRATEIQRTVLGEGHETVAATLRLLGDYLGFIAEDHHQAEQVYKQAMQIMDQLQEHEINNVFTKPMLMNNLAVLYIDAHRLEEAETLLLRSIPAWQEAIRLDSSWYAIPHENLARVYIKQDRLEEAEPILLTTLSLLERTREADDTWVAECLWFLGWLYKDQENYRKAVETTLRQLAILEAQYGPQHREVLMALQTLADLERDAGNWDNMKTYNDRHIRIAEDWFGPNSETLPLRLIDNAKVYFMREQTDSCLWAYSRALAIRQDRMDVLFRYASEAQKMGFTRDDPLIVESHLSFAHRDGSDEAVNGALDAVLHGKALVLDALAAEREIAYCVEDSSITEMIEQHNNVCSQIASFWLDEGNQVSAGRTKDTLDALFSVKDRLEAELSARCTEFQDKLARTDFTVADVSNALPDGSTLIEYVSYAPFKFEPVPRDENWEEPVYAAFVLSSNDDVNMINLGDASRIDSLIVQYRESMDKASSQVYSGGEAVLEEELSTVTSGLHELVFAPLEEFLDEGSDVYISPYGTLNLLPFDLLSTYDGHYLIEKYRISYLSSGRDLLKYRKRDGPAANRAVVVADPDYDGKPEARPEPLFAVASEDDLTSLSRGPSDRTECLADIFRPLPATKTEGETVVNLLRDNTDLEVSYDWGDLASEGTIKSLDIAPRVLHMATHGYYCDKASLSRQVGTVENPLLYSGLALAGANRFIADEIEDEERTASFEDGILTSLEATGLNLVGTDLVVLSACQSGVGSIRNGEGVYGLRRAFQLAGARTVIMSMFDIPDRATSMLMERFYSNWLSGSTKATALRDASLSILNEHRAEKGVAHPLFWGGFILVGDPD